MIFRNRDIVPTLMFHSVGLQDHPWVWSYISEPVELFEEKIRLLKNRGFNAITWSQLYRYMSGDSPLPKDSILLTFDDGYLDNWVFVYPILKKYGMKGTIFVNPDFVVDGEIVRANLEDVWNSDIPFEDLQIPGFLSWSEMRIMERSGVMDIQSHAMTHTWYFSGPRVVDYHHPAKIERYPWMLWNRCPERKPYYLSEDQSEFVEYGTPIFEHEKSLVVTRFFPDPDVIDRIRNYIVTEGVDAFYKRQDWQRIVQKKISEWFGDEIPGHYENSEQKHERITFELKESKRIIQDSLNKQVDYICWPGGGNDPVVTDIAKKVGYKSWTLGSQDISSYRNRYNTNPDFIKRMGTSNIVKVRAKAVGHGGAGYMMLRIGTHQHSLLYRIGLRIYQLWKLVVWYALRPGR